MFKTNIAQDNRLFKTRLPVQTNWSDQYCFFGFIIFTFIRLICLARTAFRTGTWNYLMFSKRRLNTYERLSKVISWYWDKSNDHLINRTVKKDYINKKRLLSRFMFTACPTKRPLWCVRDHSWDKNQKTIFTHTASDVVLEIIFGWWHNKRALPTLRWDYFESLKYSEKKIKDSLSRKLRSLSYQLFN